MPATVHMEGAIGGNGKSRKGNVSPGTATTTCLPCRRSKVRCKRDAPDESCRRCQRLQLECETPPPRPDITLAPGSATTQDVLNTISRGRSRKRKPKDGDKVVAAVINPERAQCLARTFSQLIAHQGDDRHYSARGILRDLVAASNAKDLEASASSPQTSGDAGGFQHDDSDPHNALHPYLAELFTEAYAALLYVIIGGDGRFYANEAFRRLFFSAEVANEDTQKNHTSPLVYMYRPVSPRDWLLLDQAVDYLIFTCPEDRGEVDQVLKCQPRNAPMGLSLLRARSVVAHDGNYYGSIYAYMPCLLPPLLTWGRPIRSHQQPYFSHGGVLGPIGLEMGSRNHKNSIITKHRLKVYKYDARRAASSKKPGVSRHQKQPDREPREVVVVDDGDSDGGNTTDGGSNCGKEHENAEAGDEGGSDHHDWISDEEFQRLLAGPNHLGTFPGGGDAWSLEAERIVSIVEADQSLADEGDSELASSSPLTIATSTSTSTDTNPSGILPSSSPQPSVTCWQDDRKLVGAPGPGVRHYTEAYEGHGLRFAYQPPPAYGSARMPASPPGSPCHKRPWGGGPIAPVSSTYPPPPPCASCPPSPLAPSTAAPSRRHIRPFPDPFFC